MLAKVSKPFFLKLLFLVGVYFGSSVSLVYPLIQTVTVYTNRIEKVFILTNYEVTLQNMSNLEKKYIFKTNLEKQLTLFLSNWQFTNIVLEKTNFTVISNLTISNELMYVPKKPTNDFDLFSKNSGDFVGDKLYVFDSKTLTTNKTKPPMDTIYVPKAYKQYTTNFVFTPYEVTKSNLQVQKLSTNIPIFEVQTNTEPFWQAETKALTNFKVLSNLAVYFFINTEKHTVMTEAEEVAAFSNAHRELLKTPTNLPSALASRPQTNPLVTDLVATKGGKKMSWPFWWWLGLGVPVLGLGLFVAVRRKSKTES